MSHDTVPLLVQVVSGNPVTSAAILLCLNTHDATILRLTHPVLLNTVADVPWCDTATVVHDVHRWHDALPAAEGARMTKLCPPALLQGLTSLNVQECYNITDAVVQPLPSTLHHLVVRLCHNLTPAASFTHLRSLTSLDCGLTAVLGGGLGALPPSLQVLCMDMCTFPEPSFPAASFHHHLPALRALQWRLGDACATSIGTLPPTLEVLDISVTPTVTTVSLAHLPRLRVFYAAVTSVTNDTVAALPGSLQELNLWCCSTLTPEMSFAHLRALRTLDLRDTGIGVAEPISPTSLPPLLVPLLGAGCAIARGRLVQLISEYRLSYI